MVAENPTWGAPRIHGELLKLGFKVSERTVSRWIRRAPRDPDPIKRWLTFLRNHREAIAAMDFFTVPTLTFGVLYCFFVISHDRRKILHFNVTRNPHALWIVQQLREAWAYKQPHRFLLFDRDAKFGDDVVSAVKEMGSEPTRTAFRSRWQNGVAERWVEQQVVLQKFALWAAARFNPFRDSAGCTIAMRWQRRIKSSSSEDQTLLLETRTRRGSHFLRASFATTNQPAIQNRSTYVKWNEILLMPAQRFGERQAGALNDDSPAALHIQG
jgi:transposase InsO family protein